MIQKAGADLRKFDRDELATWNILQKSKIIIYVKIKNMGVCTSTEEDDSFSYLSDLSDDLGGFVTSVEIHESGTACTASCYQHGFVLHSSSGIHNTILREDIEKYDADCETGVISIRVKNIDTTLAVTSMDPRNDDGGHSVSEDMATLTNLLCDS